MMAFDPDLPRILPRKILRGVKLPPVTPTAPCGKFSSRALARAALLSALLREEDCTSRTKGADHTVGLARKAGYPVDRRVWEVKP